MNPSLAERLRKLEQQEFFYNTCDIGAHNHATILWFELCAVVERVVHKDECLICGTRDGHVSTCPMHALARRMDEEDLP